MFRSLERPWAHLTTKALNNAFKCTCVKKALHKMCWNIHSTQHFKAYLICNRNDPWNLKRHIISLVWWYIYRRNSIVNELECYACFALSHRYEPWILNCVCMCVYMLGHLDFSTENICRCIVVKCLSNVHKVDTTRPDNCASSIF